MGYLVFMRNMTCGFKVKREGFFEKAFRVDVKVDVYFSGIWNLSGGRRTNGYYN